MRKGKEVERNNLKEFGKSMIWILGSIIFLFVIINWGYISKNIGFWWRTDVGHEVTPEPTGEPLEYRNPNTVYIPSIQLEAPLVYTAATDEAGYQAALANGVVHFPETAMPGEFGNAYYFGHSSDFPTKPGHYKTVFALLPRVNVGEQIVVTDETGRAYTYEVIERHVIKPTDTQWLSQGDKTEKILTLQTSYPVGTAISRFIVRAKLVK